jgi:hypothetical protein
MKALEMSSCLMVQSNCIAKERMTRIVAGLITGLKVSV